MVLEKPADSGRCFRLGIPEIPMFLLCFSSLWFQNVCFVRFKAAWFYDQFSFIIWSVGGGCFAESANCFWAICCPSDELITNSSGLACSWIQAHNRQYVSNRRCVKAVGFSAPMEWKRCLFALAFWNQNQALFASESVTWLRSEHDVAFRFKSHYAFRLKSLDGFRFKLIDCFRFKRMMVFVSNHILAFVSDHTTPFVSNYVTRWIQKPFRLFHAWFSGHCCWYKYDC